MIVNYLIAGLFFSATATSAFAAVREVSLEDVTRRVSSGNYFVLENAERVYQAKSSVQLARRNLLPKLNIWNIVENVASGPVGLLGILSDVVPFLVPNNWFRVDEEKRLAEATAHGYRALWANELLTARGLLLQAGLDERLLEQVRANESDLAALYSMVRTREAMGTIQPGSLKQFEVRQLSIAEELRVLEKVIRENRSQLAYLLGYPGSDEAVPSQIRYLAQTDTRSLEYGDYEAKLLASSHELKQYDALILAADKIRRSRYFNFLGASTLNRAASGSSFDSLPQQDGLGFGLGPSVKIVRSEKRVLEIQRKAIEETLKKNLKILVDSYNLDILSRSDALKRVEKTKAIWKLLTDRARLGAVVPLFDFVEASRNRVEAVSSYHAIETRILLGLDRLNRLMHWDAYQVVESPLP